MKTIFYTVSLWVLVSAAFIQPAHAADYYWRNGTGVWSDVSHWKDFGGGSYAVAPGSNDNVFFDANSFTAAGQSVSVAGIAATCRNMDWTGVTNNPNFTGAASSLNIYGSLTFVPGMTRSFTGPVNFRATTTGQTITMGTKTFSSGQISFDGVGGGWTLQDAFTISTTNTLFLVNGNLNTNSQTITAYKFNSSNTNVRTLSLGASVINVGAGATQDVAWSVNHNNLTFSAGTSVINNNGVNNLFSISGTNPVYYDVNFTNASSNNATYGFSNSTNASYHDVSFSGFGIIKGNNTLNNLSLAAGKTYQFEASRTQTINGTLSATGTCASTITISSSTAGTQATISKASGTVNLDYVSLKDINATGGATFNANNSTNLGNNSLNWNFTGGAARTLYWVGGTGNWTDQAHWSLTSGGAGGVCPPGVSDDVFFNAGSGFTSGSRTVTINAPATCRNMDWSGAANSPILAGSSNTLSIYGSVVFIGAMSITFSGTTNFEATTTGQTITSAGRSFNGAVSFQGTGGGWTFTDDFGIASSSTLTLLRGSLNTNNQTVTVGYRFDSNNTNVRSLTLGSSLIIVGSAATNDNAWVVNHTNLTFSAGTSTIRLTGVNNIFSTSGAAPSTYHNVNFTNASSTNAQINDIAHNFNNVTFSGSASINGNNSFNDLTFTPGKTYNLQAGRTQTISGSLNANGTCTNLIIIKSSGASAATISKSSGAVVINYVNLTWLTGTGGATYTANGAVNGGNNTNWSINTSSQQDLYWIGNGGNWSDGNHWSASSGGTPFGCSPASGDNVFFDANSFSLAGQTVTIDQATASCRNMTWTGVTNTPTLGGNSPNALSIYGSLLLNANMNVTFSGLTNFEATATGNTITTAGKSFAGNISFNGVGGGWTLQDNFSTGNSNSITLNNGNLNTNDKTVTTNKFTSSNTNNRTLTLGASVINVGVNQVQDVSWSVNHTNLTFNAGTSTINNVGNRNLFSVSGTGAVYYDVNFTFATTGLTYGFANDVAASYHDVSFAGDGTIKGNNTFNSLTFTPGKTYELQANRTQTIISDLNISGTGGLPVRIQSGSPGTQATFSKANDTICADYIRISDNNATGGAVFNAGTNSQDMGGNTGWNFPGPSVAPAGLGASVNPLCNGSATTLTQTGGSLGNLAYWQWYTDSTYTTKIGGQITTPDASLQVNPTVTTKYYLRAELASCIPPLPGPAVGVEIEVIACTLTWLGTTNTDWFTAGNWSPAIVPDQCATDVIIPQGAPRYPVISGANVSVGDVDIATGASITLNAQDLNVCGNWTGGGSGNAIVSGTGIVHFNSATAAQTLGGRTRFQTLQINNSLGVSLLSGAQAEVYTALNLQNGNFNASNGTLTLKSTSTTSIAIINNFSFGAGGTYTGQVVAERFYAPAVGIGTFNQHFMGSPVNTPSLSQFGASGTPGYIIPKPDCDELQSADNTPYGTVFYYDQTHNTGCGMSQWKVLTTGNAVNAQGYSILKVGSGTLSLTGAPNLDASYTLPGLSDANWAALTKQGRNIRSGWHMISNPYSATLDASVLGADNSANGNANLNFDPLVYVWHNSGAQAGSYQLATSVAPFQAFMVHKTNTTGSAAYTINGTARTTSPTTFFRKANGPVLTVTATNTTTGLTDETKVGFDPDATTAFDPWFDADKLPGSLERHTLYTGTLARWMAINTVHSIEQTSTIPMGMEPGVSGTYVFAFDGISSFDPTSYILLEDKKLNTWHNVRNGAYTFTANAKDDWERFVLHFSPPATILTTDASCDADGMINVEQAGNATWNYLLTDQRNTVVSSGTLNQVQPLAIAANTGTYILTLTDANGYTVVKNIQVGGAQTIVATFNITSGNVQAQETINFASTTDAALYTWNFGDGTGATGKNTSHSYTTEGVYTASLTVTNAEGCSSISSQAITVTSRAITGVKSVNTGNMLIWSNGNLVTVDFSGHAVQNATIDIYNLLGQQLFTDRYTGNARYSKEIGNIEIGYIIIRINNGNEIVTKKLLITNSK